MRKFLSFSYFYFDMDELQSVCTTMKIRTKIKNQYVQQIDIRLFALIYINSGPINHAPYLHYHAQKTDARNKAA